MDERQCSGRVFHRRFTRMKVCPCALRMRRASRATLGELTTIRITRKGADRVLSGHPWIFASDVVDRGGASRGAAVQVADPRGRVLGTAHYSSSSEITLRMLSRQAIAVDREFWLRRLRNAETHRRAVVRDSDSYRLVHAEADLLPALIVDRYGSDIVMQTLNQGMNAAALEIASCLEELFAPRAIVLRNDASVRRKEDLPQVVQTISGEAPARTAIGMNGLELEVDLLHGQKTGVYLDQRENYLAAAQWARGGVLDCFTSTGGFALHMARSAEAVTAVDSSEAALQAARANAARNHIGNIDFRQADVFEYLSGLDRSFDCIVLDPPAFAKSRGAMEGALRGYKEINLRALKRLNPGGVLITCSCSHHVSEASLLQVVAEAALDAGVNLRVLERRTQAQDHPILLTVPETLYLKCLILQRMPD